MIGDWKNSGLCLEDGIKPATATLITFQSIYNDCLEGDIIIDEDATFEQFGYRSTELSPQSHKKLVAICDDCGKVRILPKYNYADLCKPCVGRSPETRRRISENHADFTGTKRSPEAIAKMTGKNNPFYGKHHTEESKQKRLSNMPDMSGKNNPNWKGGITNDPYCASFNDACRESNRDKYDRRCFICNLHENENITSTGKPWKLSVHHVDMNKDQGCDDHEWKLVPVCLHCHGQLHDEKFASYIKYTLENEVT